MPNTSANESQMSLEAVLGSIAAGATEMIAGPGLIAGPILNALGFGAAGIVGVEENPRATFHYGTHIPTFPIHRLNCSYNAERWCRRCS